MTELLLVLACAQNVNITDIKEGTDNKSEITIVVECDNDVVSTEEVTQVHPVWKTPSLTHNIVHVPNITEDSAIPKMIWKVMPVGHTK